MINRENLDLSESREIKTYAEMTDVEKVEFRKEKEQDLEELKESLRKYGILAEKEEEENIEYAEFSIIEEKEKLKLIIEQKCGKGLYGIGFDGSKFYLRLDQGKEADDHPVENEFRHDENTFASLESKFSGVTFEEVGEGRIRVQIDSDHPAIAIAKFLGDKEVQLRGIDGWGNANPFKFVKTNEESRKWEAEFDWNGNYGEGADQKMKIVLESEQ
ncbi:MAG: hypothetical protein KAI71_03985 [Candidatus Pacebacteria bacterium]|nr:hypothetical protein [Candidatus Paceibacterota bacterium]